MDLIQISSVSSTVLLLIILPVLGYFYRNTPSKEEFKMHLDSDRRELDMIHETLTRLENKIDKLIEWGGDGAC